MNIKTIATRTIVAVALAVTSVAPALANNNQALNNMAMQMYAQNQALGASAYGYNPALGGAYSGVYNTNPWASAASVYGNGPTPWSAGALPAGSYATNYGYNNNYNRGLYNNAYNRNTSAFNRYWRR